MRCFRLLPLLFAAMPLCAGRAEVLVYDSFDYPAATELHDANGGLGFSDAWIESGSRNNRDLVQSSSLTFQTLTVAGNSVRSQAPISLSTELSRLITPLSGTAGRTLWVSLLVRKLSAGGTPPEDYFGLVLYPGSGDALFIGDPFENDVWSLGVAGTGAGLVGSSSPVAPNTTALLVVKITFTAGAETVRLFVNPTPGGFTPADAAANATKSDLNLADIISIGVLAGSSDADPLWSFDEIRIGATFADVAPAPSAFRQWKIDNGLSPDAPASSDGDFDGALLLVEYGLGMDPRVPSRAGLPVLSTATDPTLGKVLALTYSRLRPELIYQVETSTDLQTWTSAGVNQGGAGPLVTASVPFGASPRRFLHLRITAP